MTRDSGRGWMIIGLLAALAVLGGCRSGHAGRGEEVSVAPGINEPYRNPDLKVEEWVERFEGESREIFRERERIAKACDLRPGMTVADVGAGTGLFTMLFAEKVGPAGRVHAVDIVPAFLDSIEKRAAGAKLRNVRTVLCTERSVELRPQSVDLVFVCDTYHHFEYPRSSLASIHAALRDGGSLVIVDFKRIPGVSSDWVMGHVRAGQDVVTREIKDAGFELVDDGRGVDYLRDNYLVRFRKIANRS
ncbi:MAG: Ubiquinone/menaquinone biosynthesis C-methyltransferase UbiE [Phycisphaerae bacterium]|nr:Ubiquinone/menaquinone biosynthesis C-methyltransferase UbiE [Phycisphaerae bacterium]